MLQELRAILIAESEARAEVEKAREAGARLVAEAEEEARRIVRTTRQASDATAQAAEEACVQQAREEAEGILQAARERITRLRSLAAPRFDAAVEAVVAAVLPGGSGAPSEGRGDG